MSEHAHTYGMPCPSTGCRWPLDFEARWREVAAADPGHCTYPEAVPGWRAYRAATARTRPAEGPRKYRADPNAHRTAEAADPITRTDRDTGGMIVHWPPLDARPAEPTPDQKRDAIRAKYGPDAIAAPVGTPVTVAEIQERAEPFDSEAELVAALSAEVTRTTDAIQAVTDAVQAHAATLATEPAVAALRAAIERAGQRRPWWDPRRWWTR